MSSFSAASSSIDELVLSNDTIDELTLQLSYVLNDDSLNLDLNNSNQVLNYCSSLVMLLYRYDRNLKHFDAYSNLQDIYNNLLNSDNISPSFSLATAHFEYYMLSHLCTSLQTYRILAHNKNKTKRSEEAGNRGIISFQLEKICKDLDLDTEDLTNEIDVLNLVHKKVEQSIELITLPILQSPPKILENITIDSRKAAILTKIEDSLYNDFLQRRRMLIKRLDVTIQSFLWGKKAKGKEQDIEAAIRAQRQYLKEEPYFYRSGDALIAPLSLLYQHSKKVTEHNRNSRSLVKTIIIGAVPDRGGRTSDIRPKGNDYSGGKKFNNNKVNGGGNGGNKQGKNNNKNNSNDNKNNNNNNKGRVVTMTSE